MSLTTWEQLDRELDSIEEGDLVGVVLVFLRHRGKPIYTDGRRGRVNLSNFSRHVGTPRHKLESLVRWADHQALEETA